MKKPAHFALLFSIAVVAVSAHAAESPFAVNPSTPAQSFPLSDVRVLPSRFADAVER